MDKQTYWVTLSLLCNERLKNLNWTKLCSGKIRKYFLFLGHPYVELNTCHDYVSLQLLQRYFRKARGMKYYSNFKLTNNQRYVFCNFLENPLRSVWAHSQWYVCKVLLFINIVWPYGHMAIWPNSSSVKELKIRRLCRGDALSSACTKPMQLVCEHSQ